MRSYAIRSAIELFSSMRLAVSLLSVVAVASVIGTVLRQNEPYNNYLNQFGPFWFPLFEKLGLYSVYSAAWFLAILLFLVVSTSLCLYRNTPRMLREITLFREDLRESSFHNMAHRARFSLRRDGDVVAALARHLKASGYDLRLRPLGEGPGAATLIAAKAGLYRRVGYVLAHSAIVLICAGGLADSEFLLRLQLLLGGKKPASGELLLTDVPEQSRMPASNWSFRGNTLISEGRSSEVTVLNIRDGILVQELPFRIALKKFHIEHYSTGAPRLFASDVVVTDKDSGQSFDARIEVNHPLVHKGVAVYQASFDDGGTLLKIDARSLLGGVAPVRRIEGRIGESLKLALGDETHTIELGSFRSFNVENVGNAEPAERSLLDRMKGGMGSAAPAPGRKDLRNVGPSFQYKLRDASGQAREYHNYMLPVQVDGSWLLLTGLRDTPNEPFRYLRLPIDESGSLAEYGRLRRSLADEGRYAEVSRRFASRAASGPALSETMRLRLQETAVRVLRTFASRGYQSVAEFLEESVPEAAREKAAEVYVRILQGVAWEAWLVAREAAGLDRLDPTPERAAFVQNALNAASDSFLYGVPLYLQLSGFEEVRASVFQLTRSPGKAIVYWGCALLVLGIFAMLYLRERRLWLLVKPGEIRMAFSSNRRGADTENEFARLRAAVEKLTAP